MDVRVLAATHRDLEAMMKSGRFREDLFYRLNVVTLSLPALRERRGDIPLLAEHFLAKYAESLGERAVSSDAMDRLVGYDWPGNVRELENVIERAVIVGSGDTLVDVERFLGPAGAHAPVDLSLPFRDAKARVVEDFERTYIEGLLKSHGGKLTAAAKHADMDPKNFSDKVQRYGLRRSAPPD